ncbi:MAG: aldehyde dehydrogenase family protein [Flavobacteriaceae bacterium]|nr:aldehyde dehydrogenase family protein [Flavobacteriaceae bacterium]
MNLTKIFNELQISANNAGTSTGKENKASNSYLSSFSPIDGQKLAEVSVTSKEQYEAVIQKAQEAAKQWRTIPAPKRGELVREWGNRLRTHKEALGTLVSLEMGKSLQEGLGEVQEMIDICDFAVGLSRQLHGFTMHSERPLHRMYEQYHPMGVVGIISAFNFPVAVWAWNTALALVCGNVCLWKPSEKTPLCGVACQKILAEVLSEHGQPEGISNLINGDYTVGKWMSQDQRIPLLSATGSTRMGKAVAQTVAGRLGKSLLELGGNNAIIVTPDADIEMTVIGAVFGAVGTAGQRCTSTRRLIVHEKVYDQVAEALSKAYKQIKIGNPLNQANHMGPLIDTDAVSMYEEALVEVEKEGGRVLVEGGKLEGSDYQSGCYVKPAIVEVNNSFKTVQKETFAPILYLIKYQGSVEDAISLQNNVAQGLSSAIMTTNLREAELFLSYAGSDCGIANVNIGTSGAEIGGAFGGEKETGGGRESGSDAWKYYMRRQTNTINYSKNLPLAQGIEFNL